MSKETELLTPDDKIVKARIARKARRELSPVQLKKKRDQVLNQLMKDEL